MHVLTLPLAPDDAGKRLDKALADHLPEFSRVRLKGLIEGGQVRIGAAPVTDAARKVKGDEAVVIDLPDPIAATPQPEVIALNIVHEDEDLVVLDKAAGMVVHPSSGHDKGTLVHALLAHCAGGLSGINGVMRPGIVHRLDKDTSGLLVAAKNDRAHRRLAAQFADHGRTNALERRYVALVWGQLPRKHGTIEGGIARSSQNREKMVVSKAERARFAITHYEVIDEYAGENGVIVSRIACMLETGRTHQIRVHLAQSGHPLLGDALYGSGFKTREKFLSARALEALAALGRQALHAELLAFEHPKDERLMRFESAPPADLQALIDALEALNAGSGRG